MEWTDKITVYNNDCMEVMKSYQDNFFDLAIVDPPYGIKASNKKQYHKGAFTTYKPKSWDDNKPNANYFKELFRVSKFQIIWGGNYFTEHLPEAKNWIVWDKKQPLGITLSMHELAFCNHKGQAPIFKVSNGSNGNRCTIKYKARKRIHPTQKPVLLYKHCLRHFAQDGYKILDTHFGSGSIAIACHEFGFELVGCEIDKEYYTKSFKRFKEETAQLSLL